MHFYEIRFLPVWLQPIFLMKYRTNFAILETIHQYMVLFIKCHFLGSGELCMNYIHIGLNWLSKCCFYCHNICRRECFFSSSSHKNGGTKSKGSRV